MLGGRVHGRRRVDAARAAALDRLTHVLNVGPPCLGLAVGHALSVLFPGLTGLADGLAQKESRYAEDGDSPRRRFPRFPSPAATRRRDRNSAVLTAGARERARGAGKPRAPPA